MNNTMEKTVREFMASKELDEVWRCKVINSVDSINIVFRTQITMGDICFIQLRPECLWVNCEEEIDLQYANAIQPTLSVNRLAPITVIEYKDKNIIYMGSVRAVLYCRYQGIVDCIVVKLHTENAKGYYNSAIKRLSDFDIL